MNIDIHIGRLLLGIPISANNLKRLDLPCEVNMIGIPSDQ